jgi:hypothetical protein
MNGKILTLCAMLMVCLGIPARAAESDTSASSSYRQVMQAQYAAKTAPLPARPDEAQRIYNAYLRNIGQPANAHSPDTGAPAGTPSH